MRLYLLPEDPPYGQFLEIAGKDYHYLARVRRLKVGQRLAGADGRGGRWLCTVVHIGPSSLRLRLQEQQAPGSVQQVALRLIQGLPKGRKMDLIVRQAVEAGARRLSPVFTRYSQLRLESGTEGEAGRLGRWRRIARQAMQQSGASARPIIDTPQSLQSVLEELEEAGEEEARLVFHERRAGGDTLHRCLSKSVKIVTLVVGPEGGLAEEELELLRKHRFLPVTVGHTVLRAETAALYALAAVQTVIYERKAWKPA